MKKLLSEEVKDASVILILFAGALYLLGWAAFHPPNGGLPKPSTVVCQTSTKD